jgi:pimeloyl-ACP methyl ester carboxylesterase
MTWYLLWIPCTALAVCGFIWLKRQARFERLPALERPAATRAEGRFETVYFPAHDGSRLEGWLFRPHADNAPLVIIAPGLTGTKEGPYERFGWAFAGRGVAALLIDYRCFGGSEGEPRHWVDPERHCQDYESAIAFARSGRLPGVDGSRIALWGSSFSGGVGLVIASRDPEIRAVVVQAPYLETSPAQEPKGWAMARYVLLATLDLTGLAPVYIPALGRPGEWVFARSLENPSVRHFDGPLGAAFWRALPPKLRGGWENKFLARMLPTFDNFEPMKAIASLACPVLLVAARNDDMVLVEQVRRAHERIPARDKQLIELPCGHFDLYVSEYAEANIRTQAEFLARVMLPEPLTREAAPLPAASGAAPGALARA